jgi:hypothetical protein
MEDDPKSSHENPHQRLREAMTPSQTMTNLAGQKSSTLPGMPFLTEEMK